MKKFLRTLMLFLIIVGVLTAAVNGMYIYMQNKNGGTMSENRNNSSEIKNVPVGIQICNFGSSHGLFGFNYAEFEDKYICYNFGQPSQSISYDYRILQNYIDNFDEGAIVFITVSHFSFFGQPETDYDNFAALNKRYYKIFPPELIKEYDAKTNFFVNYAPALAAEDLQSLIETLLGKGQENVWGNITTKTAAKENGLIRYKTFVERKLDTNGERLYNKEELDALYAIVELCREHSLVPVLITTPYLAEYNKAVAENDPAFYDDFYELINKIVSDTGVIYFDYSNDSRFANDYSLFMDVDHLNRNGAGKFTDIVIADVMNSL